MWLRFFPSILLAAAACGAGSEPSRVDRVPEGQWGGVHVNLSVTTSGATLQFDCAHGSIDRAIAVEADGTFDVPGVFVREHPGPVRDDEVENRQPVRYAGRTDGKTMTLRILSEDGKTVIDEFTLTFGKPGRIFRCL
jgi:hypothetical protein